ncbi:glycosyltransferase family 2 protein [Lachnotalea sp. AF33-28]|uniref:glycosyltransferase family 2 protein n=1 Tax=Lachnotalea sp. AF33-28 TaxID=2292046 RepID=UPI000E46BC11|nr:glycosyltransferase family 2 protein [Lachnotalea sp. AF33-28]RHP35009.1 glycosyltransferase family 2 protein [Lachnotalea sp. AF33-28]
MKKLAIIPAYNESMNITKTVEDILNNAPGFDYVIVDDCSTDATRSVCRERGFNLLHLPANLGIGGAVQTGYQYARDFGYDIAVQFDGDGQHSAAYLETMVKELKEKQLDMVIGSRFIRKEGFQSTAFRQLGIRYFSLLIRAVTGHTITDPTSGMRMVNRDLIEFFAVDYPKDYPEPESVSAVLRNGKRVGEVPVIMRQRAGGVSSISPSRSIYYMVKVTLAILMVLLRRKQL